MNQVTPDEDVEQEEAGREAEGEGGAEEEPVSEESSRYTADSDPEEASDTKALLTALAIVALFVLATLAIAFLVA